MVHGPSVWPRTAHSKPTINTHGRKAGASVSARRKGRESPQRLWEKSGARIEADKRQKRNKTSGTAVKLRDRYGNKT